MIDANATNINGSGPSSCPQPCAPSPNGCLRCESIPGHGSALLFGAHDPDAEATLRKVLTEAKFEFTEIGPVLVVKEVRSRLTEIGMLLKQALLPCTQECIQAAYVPGGIANIHQAMSALMNAKPLWEMVERFEHEWVRDALNEGRLISVFHPIIHARTGEVAGHEALLRAHNGVDDKLIGAGQIISACEKLHLQHQLDQRARQAAIRGAAEHLTDGGKIFINFLPNTIYDPEICLRTTMEAAAEYRVPMDRLVFEVVETEKIPDMAQLIRILDYYRDRGMGTAIDDMGAGFTGVDYITSLKPDYVKLDREFVLEAHHNAAGRQKMDEMIKAAHEHDATIIAEGIETEAQMSMCVNAGVDYLQGFLFAKPACPPQPVKFPATAHRIAA